MRGTHEKHSRNIVYVIRQKIRWSKSSVQNFVCVVSNLMPTQLITKWVIYLECDAFPFARIDFYGPFHQKEKI